MCIYPIDIWISHVKGCKIPTNVYHPHHSVMICTSPDCSNSVYAIGRCRKHYMKDRYQRNVDEIRAYQRRYIKTDQSRAYRRNYNAQPAARARRGQPAPTRPMPTACEVCGRVSERTLHLDHCHTTGAFRGWLCKRCNMALGKFGDSIAGIERVLAYLKRSNTDLL